LTSRGQVKTREAAKGLRSLDLGIDVLLTSPLRRAAQTAKALEEFLNGDVKAEILDALEPDRPVRDVISALSKVESQGTVVLVGHEPQLGSLTASLVIGSPRSNLSLDKAGACLIGFEDSVQSGSGELVWLMPRRLLRRLGKRGKKGKPGR
jgi:phosphohistidine phosphatase